MICSSLKVKPIKIPLIGGLVTFREAVPGGNTKCCNTKHHQ